jgi:hypothetical protein
MIAGHIAPAFVAKAIHPEIHLGLAALCCFGHDFVHLALSCIRLERWHRQSSFSHSLLMAIALTLLTAGISWWVTHDAVLMLLYAGCAALHWPADLLSRQHLALGIGEACFPGLAWGRSRPRQLHALEWLLLLGSGAILMVRGYFDMAAFIMNCGLGLATLLYYRRTPNKPQRPIDASRSAE